MAAGETGCDGCGRTVSSENSTTVVMPNGERVTCCARCAPHARAAAERSRNRAGGGEAALDQRRGACDGCRGTFLEVELEDIVLDDGTVITCCPSCAAEAPGRTGADDAGTGTETETGTKTTAEAATDGAGAAVREPTGTGATAAGTGSQGEFDTGTDTDPDTGNRCSQCAEPVAHELFRVTTVDGRTERFCRSCKEDAEEKGIVKNVEMRAARAREVLGVDEDATADEIRRAYHRQVKRAHPDRKSGSRSAFRLVTDAYERLQRELEKS